MFNEIDLGPKLGTYRSIAFEHLALCNHSTYFQHLYGQFFHLNPESYNVHICDSFGSCLVENTRLRKKTDPHKFKLINDVAMVTHVLINYLLSSST